MPIDPDEGWSTAKGHGQREDRGGVRASAVVKVRTSFSTRGKGAPVPSLPPRSRALQTPSGGANVLSRPASHRRTATTEYLTG